MSEETVLRGSLEVIQRQALAVSEIIKRRGSEGWPIFQSDEKWHYETKMDDNVCPVCEKFEAREFRGDSIPTTFPHYYYYPLAELRIAYPRTHQPDPSLFRNSLCRCRLIWENPLECLEARLHDEKIVAVAI